MEFENEIKLNMEKALFNAMIAELKLYISVMGDDAADAVWVLETINRNTEFETGVDGMEIAVLWMDSMQVTALVYILTTVASTEVTDENSDYYAIMSSGI